MAAPLFRTDLVSRPIEEEGQRFVDVSDPDTGTTFRFYEVEYAIACALDGTRDLDGLAEFAHLELGLAASRDELATVLGTLDELGYLELLSDDDEAELADTRDEPLPADELSAPHEIEVEEPGGAHELEADEPDEGPTRPVVVERDDDFALGAPGRSPIARPSMAPPAFGDELELGLPGRPAATTPRAPAPRAAQLELGAAGNVGLPDVEGHALDPEDVTATAVASAPARAGSMADTDFGDEVSVDLSAHLEVGADDVKEAVRQSRVMQAVSVPDELEITADEPSAEEPTAEVAPTARPRMATPPPGVPLTPPSRPVAPVLAASKPADASVPIVLPEAPDAVSTRIAAAAAADLDAAPPVVAPRSSTTLVVLVLLVVVAAAAAAVAYFKFFRDEGGAAPAARTAPHKPAAPTKPSKPAPARVVPAAALELADATPVDVAASKPGVVAWLVDAGSEIESGQIVVKLDGFQVQERRLTESQDSLKRYQAKFDEATAKGDKVAMAHNESDIKRKQADIEKAGKALTDLVVTSSAAGVADPAVQLRARINPGDVVVHVKPAAAARATFTVPKERHLAVGDSATVRAKNDPAVTATCAVTDVGGDQVTVTCAPGSFAVGTTIELP